LPPGPRGAAALARLRDSPRRRQPRGLEGAAPAARRDAVIADALGADRPRRRGAGRAVGRGVLLSRAPLVRRAPDGARDLADRGLPHVLLGPRADAPGGGAQARAA